MLPFKLKDGKAQNYVNGQWTDPECGGHLDVENPSNGDILGRVPLSSAREMGRAIEVAHAAFPSWAATPVGRRVKPLFDLVRMTALREAEIARTIAMELGKSLPDALAEVKRMQENCEIACGMPVLQQGDKLIGASREIDGEVLRLPIGVFGMIAPFNFPGMVPFWFLPYAVAAGNTFVVKPSEQVPLTMQLMGQMMHDCGFPAGVINLVNGDHVAGQALLDHPKISGVSIVGSTPTARHVAAVCGARGIRYQALGGAKNHLVAMPDADFDPMIQNMITSCFGCAGQRCMASSVLIGVGDRMYGRIIDAFVEEAKKVIVADPLDPKVAEEEVLMGPVVSGRAKARILEQIEKGEAEGARLVLDGRGIKPPPGCEDGHFVGPTVFAEVMPGMEIHQTEIFGPVVCVMKAESLEEALAILNGHDYANGAAIYTRDGYSARRFKMEAQVGMVGINIGIPAPVAALPFGGTRGSFFSDIKAQGAGVVDFFTDQRIVTERYWP